MKQESSSSSIGLAMIAGVNFILAALELVCLVVINGPYKELFLKLDRKAEPSPSGANE